MALMSIYFPAVDKAQSLSCSCHTIASVSSKILVLSCCQMREMVRHTKEELRALAARDAERDSK